MSTGPSTASTASRCWGLSLCRKSTTEFTDASMAGLSAKRNGCSQRIFLEEHPFVVLFYRRDSSVPESLPEELSRSWRRSRRSLRLLFGRALLCRTWRLRTIGCGRVRHRRRALLFFRGRRWRQLFFDRLAREHLVALRRHVHKRRHDYRHLLKVFRLEAIVDVHVGVVGARVVLDGVLYELEAGNTYRIERKVVSAAGVAHGQGIHSEIVEGLHPGLEDRLSGLVLLQIETPDLSCAVIDVEIDGNLGLLR